MANTETLQIRLDAIARKFIHRKNSDPARGYNRIEELCNDVGDVRVILDSLDTNKTSDSSLSEFWIRAINDLVSYIEDWPLELENEERVSHCVECINSFDSCITERAETFTMTQQTRLLSIALRARRATMESVLVNVVESFGSTLTLAD